MTNFFDWLLTAPLSEILESLEGELEVFATDAYKDGEFIRFEIGFTKTDEHDWFMVHPNHPRWQELKDLPFQEIVRIPYVVLQPATQDLVLSAS